jgi:hypothetical protein
MVTSLVKSNDGKEYPAICNNAVLNKLFVSEDLEVDQYLIWLSKMSKWKPKTVLRLYRFMLYVGAVLDHKTFDIPEDQFEDWLYIHNDALVNQLTKVYFDSLPSIIGTEQKKTKVGKQPSTK